MYAMICSMIAINLGIFSILRECFKSIDNPVFMIVVALSIGTVDGFLIAKIFS